MNLHTYSPLLSERKPNLKHFVIGLENLLTELTIAAIHFHFHLWIFRLISAWTSPFTFSTLTAFFSIYTLDFESQCPGRPVLLLLLHPVAAPLLLALEKHLLQKGWCRVSGLTPAALRNFLKGLCTLWTNHCLFSHICCRVFTAGIYGRQCPVRQLFKKW